MSGSHSSKAASSPGLKFLDGVISTIVDTRVYTLDSVLRTCHRFTGLHYLHLQYLDEHSVQVSFKSKDESTAADDVTGQFLNELLDQSLRARVAAETEEVRNLILAHALSDTSLFRGELEDADPRTDPLGVAKPQKGKP